MEKIKFGLVFVIGFAIYSFVDATFFSFIQKEIISLTKVKALGHIGAYTFTLLPLLITVWFLHNDHRNILEKLGLSKNIFIGLTFAIICTLPMMIGYALQFRLNEELSFNKIIINTISSAFFEEIIYRAFLFGQLYRYTRLGFLPSVFLGSLLFGFAHLYQSNDTNELIGIFSLTFLGSLLFGWVFTEWKFNLWTAIFLHCLMNLYWLIFDVNENALGGTYANIFRFSTVFIAVFGTIIYKKKKKIKLEVKGKMWWIK